MASVYIQLPLNNASISGTVTTSESPMTPTHAQSLVVADTGVTTLTKPTSAKKVKIMALGSNTISLRVTLDGSTTPSSTVGFRIEPGRSEDFDAVGDLKVIAESTATGQGIVAHWSV